MNLRRFIHDLFGAQMDNPKDSTLNASGDFCVAGFHAGLCQLGVIQVESTRRR
jgi:hypothetical protein